MDRTVEHRDSVKKHKQEIIRDIILQSNRDLEFNYANKVSNLIIKESKKYEDEDLPLILSVFYTESKFDHNINCSRENACGIGQITPIAEKLYIKESSNPTWTSRTKLRDNIRITLWLVKYLKDEFGSKTSALAFYNGGYKQMWNVRDGKPLCRETRRYLDTISRKENEFRELLL